MWSGTRPSRYHSQRAAEHDALLELLGDGVGDQLRIDFGLAHFLDVDRHRHTQAPRQAAAPIEGADKPAEAGGDAPKTPAVKRVRKAAAPGTGKGE